MFGQRVEEEFLNDPAMAGRLRGGGGGWTLLLFIIAAIGAFIAWATTFEIEEVTRGEGRVVPAQQVQIVQSLDAGIVRSIDVAEGDVVDAGQTLMQIDDTEAAALRGELLKREAGLLAEDIRLQAETGFDRTPEFPETLRARAGDAVLAELDVLAARFDALDREVDVLETRLAQKRTALDELLARRTRIETIIEPLAEEIELTEELAKSGSVPRVELLRLRARMAELEGDLAVGRAQETTLSAAIDEALQEIDLARAGYVLTARQRRAKLGVELAVVRENLRAAQDRVTRTQLQAPVRGVVNAVNVSTVGQVIEPGRPLVEIVPMDDRLEIEVNIQPKDVAFIQPGDAASVKISAYDYLVYGALAGEVARIGADTIRDAEGREFFQVVIRSDDTSLGRNGENLPITAGMQASVDIQTGTRPVLSYLLAPVFRMQSEALRER